MKKVVFLDRDGVINKLSNIKNNSQSPKSLKELQLNKYIVSIVKYLRSKNYLVIMVTNQPDVSRKILTKASVEKINLYIMDKIKLDDFFVCYSQNNKCFRRKPNPGMLIDAKKKWNISFKKSYLVGDRDKDIEAGNKAGVKTIFFFNKKNQEKNKIKSNFKIKSLKEIYQIIK
tara:strand:- start:2954 stop:3472 length:519 start_codon:yes stop_codon:yes gene_type:complete